VLAWNNPYISKFTGSEGKKTVSWLDKIERKFRFKGIKGLMNYIIALNAAVFILAYLDSSKTFLYKLVLDAQMVMQGEIWRLITFIFIPPTFSPFWLVFALYFYYLIGSSLEREWGSFKFNVYYFMGIILTIIGSFISGGITTSFYLNLSLFLAFAALYPNFQVMLFFILPVKMKYLAYVNVAYFILVIIIQPLSYKIASVASVLNFLVFFGKDLYVTIFRRTKSFGRYAILFNAKLHSMDSRTIHKCEICGKTEKDDINLEFRYCSECDGDHEYCMEHLESHEHVKNS